MPCIFIFASVLKRKIDLRSHIFLNYAPDAEKFGVFNFEGTITNNEKIGGEVFNFPRTLHPLYLFEEDAAFYAADLEKASVVELSAVMVDILKLAEKQTSEEIVQALKTAYRQDEIYEAFERFAEFEQEGLLFNRGEALKKMVSVETDRRKLLVAIPGINVDSYFDKVGMIPAEQIIRVEQANGAVRYEKRQVAFSSRQDNRTIISPDPAGLTAEEIVQLQNLAAEGDLAEFGNRVNIQPSIGFAPVIFLGTLLTVLCQGPFYLKLRQFF